MNKYTSTLKHEWLKYMNKYMNSTLVVSKKKKKLKWALFTELNICIIIIEPLITAVHFSSRLDRIILLAILRPEKSSNFIQI